MVPVSFAPLVFAGEEWRLVEGRALHWPREAALVVADLHLEKASWYAARGQMLPPYDSRATLERLAQAIGASAARRVFCLGDNFHDAEGPSRMEPQAARMLAQLTRAVDFVWITGNHDTALGAGMGGGIGGVLAPEITVGGIVLRHHAQSGERAHELSGHFHPRLALSPHGRRIARPCAVASEARMILPAFGALTGGMKADDPAILAVLQPARAIRALVAVRDRLLQFSLWQENSAKAAAGA
ncbi:MAG: ligase-associated DNA damage response endonuclease PdeM [Sphingomonadales bacterium]|nr:ligase-associated DNA damage response endonuclease PdeM [Sphingomonadales bacterium]